jgi:hypothetical protein
MNELNSIPANTKIKYDNGLFYGEGIIVGISTNFMPVIGRIYMVKDLSGNIPNEVYKYDTFSCLENQLKVI